MVSPKGDIKILEVIGEAWPKRFTNTALDKPRKIPRSYLQAND